MRLVNRRRFLGQPYFPVINLGRRFLGQEIPVNRLLGVRTNIILSRGQLILPAEMQKSLALAASKKMQFAWELTGPVDIQDWTPEERAALEEVAASPTQEELDELAKIDSFFDGLWCKGPVCTKGTPYQGNSTALQVMCGRDWRTAETFLKYYANNSGYYTGTPPWQGAEYNVFLEKLKTLNSNPFYCAPWVATIIPSWVPSSSTYGQLQGIAREFDLDLSKPWGEIKLPLDNAITFMNVMKDYPFPIPINMMPQFWFRKVTKEVQNLIHQPVRIPAELVDFWATMSILINYDAVSKEIVEELKRRAEKQMIIDILTNLIIGVTVSVAIAGVAAAIAPLLPAGIPTTEVLNSVKTAIDQIVSIEEKKQAARDMEKAAKQFEATDAAFAKKVDSAAKFLERAAAEEELLQPTTPEEVEQMARRSEAAAAIPNTGSSLYDVPAQQRSDLLPIVGGVAAVGLLAVLLTTLK